MAGASVRCHTLARGLFAEWRAYSVGAYGYRRPGFSLKGIYDGIAQRYKRWGRYQLTTKLDTQLKRELIILGKPYTLVISLNGLALTPKGRRKGYELAWVDLVSGDAALAVALNASLARGPKPDPAPTKPPRPTAKSAKSRGAKRARAKAS